MIYFEVWLTQTVGWHETPIAGTRNEKDVPALLKQCQAQRGVGELFSVLMRDPAVP